MHNTKGDIALRNMSRETKYISMILYSIQNKIICLSSNSVCSKYVLGHFSSS